MTSIVTILVLFGVFFSIVAGIGILRLPDMYSRLHAASKSSTLGVSLVLLAVFIYFWYFENQFEITLILALVFIYIIAPTGAHMLARSAFHSDVEPYRLTILNELRRDELGYEELTEEDKRKIEARKKEQELDE
ncbi:monovalent cation/H(+) antiporter subunit G [Nosocomiicoccus ampullae]|uniref:Multicomponent Na+:H+ antiporter subunit G n=1 Tax=Nosocomiicoccus ampullae TaxID=489910 RepID=A0A9Q2HF26_9STAP|nr:monovalent cation/H(+) antiporter subunit G [Nosocomiicoccus ampullae]MBB5175809.1 multicomponent Na+:H+ antiporter subunit G [Nosocomiicoccus ampullae]